jgi:hypothetical protein
MSPILLQLEVWVHLVRRVVGAIGRIGTDPIGIVTEGIRPERIASKK